MVKKYKNKVVVLKFLLVMGAIVLVQTLIMAILKSSSTDNLSKQLELVDNNSFPPNSKFRNFIPCKDKDFESKILQHGIYWMLKNYVKATKYFKCDESITYTTNADFSFLDNLVPLLEHWQGPISIAVWAPESLFEITLDSIAYLRNCHDRSELVRELATFHIFFERLHFPKTIPKTFDEFEQMYICPTEEPFAQVEAVKQFKEKFNATFPINVARNLARESALTHFVLASDIELYPSPGLINQFFAMIAKDPKPYLEKKNVFVLPAFEVESDQQVPQTKSELAAMKKNKTSVWFHYKFCKQCHLIPNYDEWFLDTKNSEMSVFQSVKRRGEQSFWEPFYIGTNDDPLWDERLDWEGKANKMQQAFIMCLLDYNYNVLSNAFLCHKPGIKSIAWKKENVNPVYQKRSANLLFHDIKNDLKVLYNDREGCNILSTIFRGEPKVPGDFPSHLISFKEEKKKVL